VGKLDKLEAFASDFGADFYRLPRNSDRIRLAKREWKPPASYPMGEKNSQLVPMRAGEKIAWRLVS
jgi:dihydroorotase